MNERREGAEGGRLRWGILATGRIADWFATDFPFVRDGELVAVASRTLDKARAFAGRHSIPRAYGGHRELLSDPDVDIVYIATPHSCHVANVEESLRAGKAVLCEKPLTIDASECRRLIDLAEELEGSYLMEAMWTWFLPAIYRAQEWVDQGRIGALRHVKVDFGYPVAYHERLREYDADLGGGALLEMGIYAVAFAWLFLRQEPRDIDVVAHRAPNGVEDDVVAIFDYGDVVATLGTSFRCKLQNWAYIIGENGYIAVPDFWRASECSLYELDERVDHFREDRAHQGFCHEANAVNEDLRAGRRESPRVSLADSLCFQRHIELIRQRI